MENEFRIEGNGVFSVKTGQCIAALHGSGRLTMSKGYAGYRKRVENFLASAGTETRSAPLPDETAPAPRPEPAEKEPEPDENPPPPVVTEEGGAVVVIGTDWIDPEREKTAGAVRPEPEPGTMTEADMLAASIPAEELPEYSKKWGMATPAFREFVRKHRMTQEQALALRKRILKMQKEEA